MLIAGVIFSIFGYLCGSVLFARVFERVFCREGFIDNSKDKNPGTANAFLGGGMLCGILTLLGDVTKGALPILLFKGYCRWKNLTPIGLAFVIAAPVLGHAFPVFYHFKGGKGIATTFGCLFGLLPDWKPLAIVACCFIFFSVAICIKPHFYRTLVVYGASFLLEWTFGVSSRVLWGCLLIMAIVFLRMRMSPEKREKFGVTLGWSK